MAQNRDDYSIPLKVLSYKELYGWTMDSIVAEVKTRIVSSSSIDLINIQMIYIVYARYRLVAKTIARFVVSFGDKRWTEVPQF